MGLTLHYTLRLPARLEPGEVEALVRRVHRRAAALVRRRGLVDISPVEAADPDNPIHGQFVLEKVSADETRGHDVTPECGWMFSVHPGAGCESAAFGLCFFPATIRVGRRRLRTSCGGWSWTGFAKTQYASLRGSDHFLKCHRAVVDLALLWEQAGAVVSIKDEGGYWPGRNEARLLAEVGSMNQLVAAFGGALKDAADEGGPAVTSSIFAHGQFELLEAQGLNQHAAQIAAAVRAVKRTAEG